MRNLLRLLSALLVLWVLPAFAGDVMPLGGSSSGGGISATIPVTIQAFPGASTAGNSYYGGTATCAVYPFVISTGLLEFDAIQVRVNQTTAATDGCEVAVFSADGQTRYFHDAGGGTSGDGSLDCTVKATQNLSNDETPGLLPPGSYLFVESWDADDTYRLEGMAWKSSQDRGIAGTVACSAGDIPATITPPTYSIITTEPPAVILWDEP